MAAKEHEYRKTKKLLEAINYLASDEGRSDTSSEAWFIALQSGKVTSTDIYKAMVAFGMKWDTIRGYWYTKARRMNFVKTMFTTVRKINSKIDKDNGDMD
jgi:hypothetical protein